jgi:hypothetical protein
LTQRFRSIRNLFFGDFTITIPIENHENWQGRQASLTAGLPRLTTLAGTPALTTKSLRSLPLRTFARCAKTLGTLTAGLPSLTTLAGSTTLSAESGGTLILRTISLLSITLRPLPLRTISLLSITLRPLSTSSLCKAILQSLQLFFINRIIFVCINASQNTLHPLGQFIFRYLAILIGIQRS